MEIYRLFLFREFSVGIDTKAPVPTLFRDIKFIAEGAKCWESTWDVTYGPPFEQTLISCGQCTNQKIFFIESYGMIAEIKLYNFGSYINSSGK